MKTIPKHRLLKLWNKYQFESLSDLELEELLQKLEETYEFLYQVNTINSFYIFSLLNTERKKIHKYD